jgi:hypothetical protein
MLRVRHIPGNGTAQRPGSTRACQQESQNTPGQTNSNPHYDAKLRIKGQPLSSPLVLPDRRTCKAAFRHVKVRRRCYCEAAMKSE